MGDPIVPTIIAKYLSDREVIKEVKARHAEELRVLEEFQSKREAALFERAGMEAFEFFTDLFVNGRDGKAEKKKEEENISLNQQKIESWLLKMLDGVGEGIRTSAGTVFKTRKESVTVADFDSFTQSVMLQDAAKAVEDYILANGAPTIPELVTMIHDNMHLELLNKAVNKTAILELMGNKNKDGSYEKAPPIGINYVSMTAVGVRKAK